MKFTLLLVFSGALFAQTPDPAYVSLSKAYDALRVKNYDVAITGFLSAIAAAPERGKIREDLAYTYLKTGENEAARDQFGEAVRLNPADLHVAMEYAFLCYDTKQESIARRIFDRVRKTGDATAEQAFQNIDGPLKSGIERWTKALSIGPDNFSAHFDLAVLAEQRDELDLAAEHYLKAWKLLPARRAVLIDLGRVWKTLNQVDYANAALLAASRGGEPRAAEAARELLPNRYPYVYEFRKALTLDPQNTELHRELAYLLMSMSEKNEAKLWAAEQEFRIITESNPADLLSNAQLGFMYLSRKDTTHAMPLLQRVLQGSDEGLANRVRLALHMPIKEAAPRHEDSNVEARTMADRSFQAGYLKDAVKYLKIALDADPVDFAVMLKLGRAYNMLHDDKTAIRWFALARKSPDRQISGPAIKAFNALRPDLARFRTTAWLFPFYSTRWHDLFSYAQIKTDVRLERLPFRPYISIRFVGDLRQTESPQVTGASPQYLSESSFIVAGGIATKAWHRAMAWGEAGSAISYVTRRMQPDYRDGVSWSRSLGHGIHAETGGLFFESNSDGVFVSRFGNDFLGYMVKRASASPRITCSSCGITI